MIPSTPASWAVTAVVGIAALPEGQWQATSQVDGPKLKSWSSFIGIVTAIVGNVFISIALNLQRYAHIRLDRELRKGLKCEEHGGTRDQAETKSRTDHNPLQGGVSSPSDQPTDAALVSDGDTHGESHEADEGTPLISHHKKHSLLDKMRTRQRTSESPPATDPSQRTYLSSRIWWAGIILMTIGETGNFIAYGFAPASIVSPLGVVALISNCVIAPIMLKEEFRRQDLLGVLVAIAGAVTVVLSAKTSERKLGPHEVWHAITQWEFEVYLTVTAGLILAGLWASNKYGGRTSLIDLGLVALFGEI